MEGNTRFHRRPRPTGGLYFFHSPFPNLNSAWYHYTSLGYQQSENADCNASLVGVKIYNYAHLTSFQGQMEVISLVWNNNPAMHQCNWKKFFFATFAYLSLCRKCAVLTAERVPVISFVWADLGRWCTRVCWLSCVCICPSRLHCSVSSYLLELSVCGMVPSSDAPSHPGLLLPQSNHMKSRLIIHVLMEMRCFDFPLWQPRSWQLHRHTRSRGAAGGRDILNTCRETHLKAAETDRDLCRKRRS